MNSKILGLLGLMRRAGKLTAGFDAVSDRIKDNTAALIVLAGDTSEKTAENISWLGAQKGVPALRIEAGMEEVGVAIGRKKAGVLAVNDRGFAKKLSALALESGSDSPEGKQGGIQ